MRAETNTFETDEPVVTLRDVFLAQPLNPLVPLVFKVVPTRTKEDKSDVAD